MRRLLPSALLVLCCTMPCLCASMYSSNAMMQRLDAITAIPETGYFIVEDGDESILYLDGEEVRRVVQRADEVVTSDDNGVNVVRLQDGRPIGETTSDGIDISYEYAENGTLYRAVYSKDNQILRVVQYLVTPSGFLAGHFDLSGDAAVFYSGSRFSYRTADGVQTASGVDVSAFDDEDATLPIADAVRLDDGTSLLVEESDDGVVESLYDQSLHLIHRKVTRDGEPVSQTSWSYDENGHVVSMEVVEDDVRTVYEYNEDGEVRCQSEYVDGQLREVRMNRDDDTVLATRYRDGAQYARIVYDRDGSRVLSLEMLR